MRNFESIINSFLKNIYGHFDCFFSCQQLLIVFENSFKMKRLNSWKAVEKSW